MMVSKRHLLFGWFFSGSMLNSRGIIPLILETPETNSEITEQVEPSETETIICQTMCFLGRLASWGGQICTWNIEWNILDILNSKNINCLYQLLSFHNILCLASASLHTPRKASRPCNAKNRPAPATVTSSPCNPPVSSIRPARSLERSWERRVVFVMKGVSWMMFHEFLAIGIGSIRFFPSLTPDLGAAVEYHFWCSYQIPNYFQRTSFHTFNY